MFFVAIFGLNISAPPSNNRKYSSKTTNQSTTQQTKSSVKQPDPPRSFSVRKFTKSYKDVDADNYQSTWKIENYSVIESSELKSKMELAYKTLVLHEDTAEFVEIVQMPNALVGVMNNGEAVVLMSDNPIPQVYNDEKYTHVQIVNQTTVEVVTDNGHKLVINV